MNQRPTPQRWSQNPYAAFRPHMGALSRSGIQYIGGAPVRFAPQQVGIIPPQLFGLDAPPLLNPQPAPQQNPAAFDPAVIPALKKQMADWAALEEDARQEALKDEAQHQYQRAVDDWRTAQHFALLQAQLSSDWPAAKLEEGVLVKASVRAQNYGELAKKAHAAATGTVYVPPGPAAAPAAESGVPGWVWLVGLVGLGFAAWRYFK